MLRSDFDTHPLWNTLEAIEADLDSISGDHQTDELPNVERIRVQMAYVRSFDVVASTRAAFFHPEMLNDVRSVWENVNSSTSTRVANGTGYANYVQQAADMAESALMKMAAWPRPYGRGGEVKQMDTLFEKLLEAQRESMHSLGEAHEELRQEVSTHSKAIEQRKAEADEALTATKAELEVLADTIEAQKAEVTEFLEESSSVVKSIPDQVDVAFSGWAETRKQKFDETFDPLRAAISTKLEEADNEYEALINAKEKYTKLVSAIAADEVASQFESEAAWGRKVGNRFYLLGFGLLIAAALPLAWLLIDPAESSNGGVDWNFLVVRLAIGALAGSAATVAIRLGGRLISNANAVKRMELELRAIGPFLANVSEKPKVDDAFVDLVSKAFGNAYTPSSDKKSSSETAPEAIPASSITQLFEILERARKISGPNS